MAGVKTAGVAGAVAAAALMAVAAADAAEINAFEAAEVCHAAAAEALEAAPEELKVEIVQRRTISRFHKLRLRATHGETRYDVRCTVHKQTGVIEDLTVTPRG